MGKRSRRKVDAVLGVALVLGLIGSEITPDLGKAPISEVNRQLVNANSDPMLNNGRDVDFANDVSKAFAMGRKRSHFQISLPVPIEPAGKNNVLSSRDADHNYTTNSKLVGQAPNKLTKLTANYLPVRPVIITAYPVIPGHIDGSQHTPPTNQMMYAELAELQAVVASANNTAPPVITEMPAGDMQTMSDLLDDLANDNAKFSSIGSNDPYQAAGPSSTAWDMAASGENNKLDILGMASEPELYGLNEGEFHFGILGDHELNAMLMEFEQELQSSEIIPTQQEPLAGPAVDFEILVQQHQQENQAIQNRQRRKTTSDSSSSAQQLDCRDLNDFIAKEIPFDYDTVMNAAPKAFAAMLTDTRLDAEGRELMKAARRRYKNRIAARNCRQRRVEDVTDLGGDVEQLHLQREQYVAEVERMETAVAQQQQRVATLSDYLVAEYSRRHPPTLCDAEYRMTAQRNGTLTLIEQRSVRA